MQKVFLFIACFVILTSETGAQVPPIGEWREHLSYNQAIGLVQTPSKIYCATPFSFFSLELADNTIERFSKINGLSEVGIQSIQWDAITGKLIIAYTNSNIDIRSGGKIQNIDAFKLKPIPSDKTINNIFCYQGLAYLSTGLGIIVVDEDKIEIKDTYLIGNNGSYVKVNNCTTDGNFFYAATQEGLKAAPVNTVNLSDYKNWQLLSGNNGLPVGEPQNLLNISNTIVLQQQDTLWRLKGGNWNRLYADGWSFRHVDVSGNQIILSEQLGNLARVLVINLDGTIGKTIAPNNALQAPKQALLFQNSVWIADSVSGLLEFSGGNATAFRPNSPQSIATGALSISNNILWAAAGAVTSTYINTNNKNGLYRFAQNEWTNFNATTLPAMDSLRDIVSTAIDPSDHSVWAGSFGGGLLHIKPDNSLQVYKQQTGLAPSFLDLNKYYISGLAFDNENNLWIADYGATQNLVVRKPGGTWNSWFVPYPLSNNAVGQIVIDNFNQKWIASPGGNGLICFNHGQSIDNFSDDQWKQYKTGIGNGNLPDNQVLSLAVDKNSFIWVGTVKGIGVIQCPQQVFSAQGCDAVLPVVQQDNFAGYLFADEQVQSIAVDGADRKWVGTKNGAWLLSSGGDNIIYRFSADNSPLLDNDVQKIAIDGKTGEVFFSTAKGICSFTSTATDGTPSNTSVLVFPNPVPPAYNGTIAIRGLVDNAIVKITELNGRLVYQTRSLGGQAIWYGKDYTGRTIATGVYLVLVSDDTRQEKIVTKIVFISK